MNFYFIMVPLRKKVLKYGTPKPSIGPSRELVTLKSETLNPIYGCSTLIRTLRVPV